MSQPVIIENDAIRMEVYPHIGGKVASLIDKADKFDLMFDYPVELPTRPQYDIRFDDSWYAGWDECFPAVAPGKYPLHPYEGINVPDHGELWGLPTMAVPTKNGITTVWHGLRFGYRLTRKLYLEDASIRAEYTLVNLAPFEFRYVWSMHSLMSMKSSVQLDLQSAAGSPQFRFSHDEVGVDHQMLFDWPMVSPDVNVSDFTLIPAATRMEDVFDAAHLITDDGPISRARQGAGDRIFFRGKPAGLLGRLDQHRWMGREPGIFC